MTYLPMMLLQNFIDLGYESLLHPHILPPSNIFSRICTVVYAKENIQL